jgi:hypothetical protein
MGNTRRVAIAVALLACTCAIAGCSLKAALPGAPGGAASSESTGSAGPPPTSVDGLTFVSKGALWEVASGNAEEILKDGRSKLAVSPLTHGSGLVVTEASGDGADVMELGDDDGKQSTQSLAHVASASQLAGVRVDASAGTYYLALDGDPAARLVVARAGDSAAPKPHALGRPFGGEFDLDSSGGGVVYTSVGQNPARLWVTNSGGTHALTPPMATVFSPAVSPKNGDVCFTGTSRTGDKPGLWVLDRAKKSVKRIAAAAGLAAQFPVFSASGKWIAFRSGTDGRLRIVRADGSGMYALPFSADEAPLAW